MVLLSKDALNYIKNLIYENLNKIKPVAIAFLGLTKAFATVDHIE